MAPDDRKERIFHDITTINEGFFQRHRGTGHRPARQTRRADAGTTTAVCLHNIGPDYDPTLMAWYARFTAAWPALRAKYGERFFRMWTYYLLMSAAAFRARYLHLFQIVMSRSDAAQPDCRRS